MCNKSLASVTIRLMRRDDIPDVIILHRQAFGGSLGAGLGQIYLTTFFEWFLTYDQAVYLVADQNNVICGYILGASHGYGHKLNRAIFWQGIVGILRHPNIIFHPNFKGQFFSRVQQLLPPWKKNTLLEEAQLEDEKVFSLVGIGVHPEMRRMGIGEQLLEKFYTSINKDNFDRIRLTVYPDNLKARRFYEKNDWYLGSNKVVQNKTIVYYFNL